MQTNPARIQRCGRCGAKENHPRKSCPAAKPGIDCTNCYGEGHFSLVCRSEKDKFKKRWLKRQDRDASGNQDKGRHMAHMVEYQEEDTLYDMISHEYAFSLESMPGQVNHVESANRKLFTSLALSTKGTKTVIVQFQVDTAASCNTLPLSEYLKVDRGKVNLCPSRALLHAYSGSIIRPIGCMKLLCKTTDKFLL